MPVSETVEGLRADVFLLEVGIVGRGAVGDGVGGRRGGPGENGLAGDALEGVVEDVEAAGGIVDVGGEERGVAAEVRCDELTALVIDAARGGAGDVRGGGVSVDGPVGEEFVGEDFDGGGEWGVGDWGDEDSGDDDLDAAVVAGHGVGLAEAHRNDDGTEEKAGAGSEVSSKTHWLLAGAV